MPRPCRRGSAFGTSSSLSDSRFAAVFVRSSKFFGERFDLSRSYRCDLLVDMYKECVMKDHLDCNFYLKRRPENCLEFNEAEYLRTVGSSDSTSTG